MISNFCFLAIRLIAWDTAFVPTSFGPSSSPCSSNPQLLPISSFHSPRYFTKRTPRPNIPNVLCANHYADDLDFTEIDDEGDEDIEKGNTTRHPIYWIDEVEPHRNTRSLAAKNAKNMFKFLRNKSPAPYNVQAFEYAKAEYDRYCRQVATIIWDTTS